jgi:two-component system sensor histidine kinase KdpD
LAAKRVIVKIADRGPGLNPNDIERIFDRFYQGRKPEMNGVGLGLALCKSVIQAHGGEIWAVNRENGGAMFCFTLPIADRTC